MQVTEARIYPSDEDIVRAYVTIAFDNWLMIRQIKVIRSTTGQFVSMPAKSRETAPIDSLLIWPMLEREG